MNAYDKSHYTALHSAVMGNDHAMVAMLLQEGALMHSSYSSAQTPFNNALEKTWDGDQMTEVLLHHGFDGDEAYDYVAQPPRFVQLGRAGMLIRHLMRRELLSNDAVVPSEFGKYYVDCKREVERMRADSFFENVSFHTILTNRSQYWPYSQKTRL